MAAWKRPLLALESCKRQHKSCYKIHSNTVGSRIPEKFGFWMVKVVWMLTFPNPSNHHSTMASMAVCYKWGHGFKSRQGRELLILNKKKLLIWIWIVTWCIQSMCSAWCKLSTNTLSNAHHRLVYYLAYSNIQYTIARLIQYLYPVNKWTTKWKLPGDRRHSFLQHSHQRLWLFSDHLRKSECSYGPILELKPII